MPCSNPYRLNIHLAFNYSVGTSCIVWTKLGLAPNFQGGWQGKVLQVSHPTMSFKLCVVLFMHPYNMPYIYVLMSFNLCVVFFLHLYDMAINYVVLQLCKSFSCPYVIFHCHTCFMFLIGFPWKHGCRVRSIGWLAKKRCIDFHKLKRLWTISKPRGQRNCILCILEWNQKTHHITLQLT